MMNDAKMKEVETDRKPQVDTNFKVVSKSSHHNENANKTPVASNKTRHNTEPSRNSSGSTVGSKKQTLAQIRALNVRATALEKDITSKLLRFRMVEGRDKFEALEKLRQIADSKRIEEKAMLKTQFNRANANIDQFKVMLTRVNSASGFVDQVQRLVEQIETNILKLKDGQRDVYAGLVAQEKMLQRELIEQQETFESWETIGLQGLIKAAQSKGGMPLKRGAQLGEELPEAARLTSFLRKGGGLSGGWSEYDHGVFLRERQRHAKAEAAIAATCSKLVGKKETDCREHEKFYSEFLRLTESKRNAIRKWKTQKENQQLAELESRKLESSTKAKEEATRRSAIEQKKKSEIKRKAAVVAKWKEEKLQLEVEHQQRLQQQHDAEVFAMKSLEHQRHQAKKAQVQGYIEKKKEQEASVVAAAELTHAASVRRVTTAELKHFRERDELKFKDQMAKRAAAAESENLRLRRLENLKKTVHVEAERDPSRLTRPTAASLARKQDKTNSGGQVQVAIPRRAVPSWRQT